MTSKQPYPEEFKIKAVKQITERGHRVADVSARIGVSQHSLYKWIKALFSACTRAAVTDLPGRGTSAVEGRAQACDRGARHPKKGRRVLCQAIRVRYTFIKQHEQEYPSSGSARVVRPSS